MPDSKVCILAPCYNEGQVVVSFLNELKVVLKETTKSIRLVIVDDGSTDNTRDLLKEFNWVSKIELDIVAD